MNIDIVVVFIYLSSQQFCITIYLLLFLLEDLPYSMIIFGLIGQVIHLRILDNFPFIDFASVNFISGLLVLIINHYLAFSFFSNQFYPFSHVLGYFTIMWLIPFAYLISLSANDRILPTVDRNTGLPKEDSDLISSYFSTRKRVGLLSLFQSAKETLLPQTTKKRMF